MYAPQLAVGRHPFLRSAGSSLLGICLALLGTAGARAQTYGVATMQPGTLSHSTGSAIAKVMQQSLGLQSRVQPNAGESVLLPLVNSGEIDVGIANIMEVANAYQGKDVPAKQEKLRIVGVIHPLRVGFFVRKDSPVKTTADLKGRKVTLGFSAMRTIDGLAQAILATGGLTEKDVQRILVPNVIRSADDFVNATADCFFFALGAGKVNEVDASVGGIRLVDIPDSRDGLAAARRIFPYFYLSTVAPRPGLPGVAAPTRVATYDNLLVASTATKDEVIYKLVGMLIEKKDDLGAVAPWLREISTETVYKKFPVPYHAGAEKWFKEKGIAQR